MRARATRGLWRPLWIQCDIQVGCLLIGKERHVIILENTHLASPTGHAGFRGLYMGLPSILSRTLSGAISIPILKMGKLRPREVEETCPRSRGQ